MISVIFGERFRAGDNNILANDGASDQRVSFEVVTDDRRGKPRADRVRVLT